MSHERGILVDPVSAQRGAVAAEALGGGVELGPVPEEGDPAVPHGDQVLDRHARAAHVVADDRVRIDEVWRPIDEHELHPRLAVACQVALVPAGGGYHQPIDAPRAEGIGQRALALGVLVRAADEREHPSLARDLLHATVDRREERVRDVLPHEPDAGRLPVGPAQRAGGVVAPVAQEPGSVAHALGQGGIDGPAVDHPRHGAEAHARERSDVLHRRAARGARATSDGCRVSALCAVAPSVRRTGIARERFHSQRQYRAHRDASNYLSVLQAFP